ncbi:putative Aldo-keto reductase [Seiridium cardinale]|uniref:Aldo-keto reductase n=1 Tax=Seiridium cardinale TaxID=138064 RepID=A0ABR2XMI8_9PEZI
MATPAVTSRQKSCNACVRSKRRCDKRSPICNQCTKKKCPCIYGGRASRHATSADGYPMEIDADADNGPIHLPSPGQDVFRPDSTEFPFPLGPEQALENSQFHIDPMLDSLLNVMPESDLLGGFWQNSPFMQQDLTQSGGIEKGLTRTDYSKMNHICFARESCTPFLHRHLYKDNMPHWILQAFSMSVLYAHKNDSNRGMVLRALHDNVKSLHESASGSALKPQEKLARVHALMLYQLMRMFDGDITLGSQADNDTGILDSWLAELYRIRDNLDSESEIDEAELRNQPPESWERWIFAESVRKTYIFGEAVIFFWNLLKGRANSEQLGVWATIHRWTLSSHLWNATDSYSFFDAWKSKPFFVISGFALDHFFESGRDADVDDFARIFLTMYFGVSEMKTFAAKSVGSSSTEPHDMSGHLLAQRLALAINHYFEMSQIPTRPLGKDGPLVPRIGFGTMGLSYSYTDRMPDEQRFAVLDHAHKIGETFWDSSDVYADSEDLLGKWFARTGKRSDIFLATKFGGIYLGPGKWSFRGDAAYVREACDKSLKRLGVDHIDLYYPHRLDGSTPVEHIVAEMVKLKEQGKIRHIGLSEVSSETLRRAHAVHPIAAVQMEYSPFTTDIEDPKIGLLDTCRELGVAVVAYSPLSRGLLTGQVRSHADFDEGDIRRFFPRFSEENFPKNLKIVDALGEIAAKKSCTAGQLSLAWLLSQGGDIFPIPGTSKIKYLEENFAAAHVELTSDEIAHIRSLVDNAASGAKWPDKYNLALFADTPLP